jgi:hypothetical protein
VIADAWHPGRLLPVAVTRPGSKFLYAPVMLPKLDILAVNELLRVFDGSRIVDAIEVDRFYENAVNADEVRAIVGHASTLAAVVRS